MCCLNENRNTVTYETVYKYLGFSLNEHLNYESSVEILAASAGRALGAIVTKMIKNGGFPINVYKKLFESCACSVSDYAGEVWGYKQYECTRKILLRAARAYLGASKISPNVGVLSEINWLEPRSRTQVQMIRQYHRILKMDADRLTKKVYFWDRSLNSNHNVQTWNSEVRDILERSNLEFLYNSDSFCLKSVVGNLKNSLLKKDQVKWRNTAADLPKLRTFVKFKNFHTDSPHIYKALSFIQRKFTSKLRLGTLPLRVETGRYTGLAPHERFCLMCDNAQTETEDEIHFLLYCQAYRQRRLDFFNTLPDHFHQLDETGKLSFLLNDSDTIKMTSRFIVDCFDYRSTLIN